MVTSLFKYDRIKTTDTKAKELKRWADHLITLAKRGDLHARRQALSIVREKDVVHKLFEEAAERYGTASGGYTRSAKLKRRHGDAALITMIELMAPEKSKRKKKAIRKKGKSEIEEKPAAEEKAEEIERDDQPDDQTAEKEAAELSSEAKETSDIKAEDSGEPPEEEKPEEEKPEEEKIDDDEKKQ